MSASKPLVSICCITYNHENFIREAVDGFLMQKTSFPIEIIIHDDASTDGTASIIREYQKKNPHLIRSVLQIQNQYSLKGFGFLIDLLKKAQGKYIALCEGDDYWIDPVKLQKQVDFLEENEDFSICFHKIKILENGQFRDDYITQIPANVSGVLDLANLGNYIHTPSCVFRNQGIKAIGPHFHESPVGDYYLHMINAQYGKIYHIDEVMAVYRIHSASSWSNKDVLYRFRGFQQARLAVLKDLSPNSYEAYCLLANAYLREAIEFYLNFKEKSISQDVAGEANLLSKQLAEVLFQKLDDLEAVQELAQRTLFKHFIDAIKKRLNRFRPLRKKG